MQSERMQSGRIESTLAKTEYVGQASRLISIARLNLLPDLHLRPIYLVIYKEPSGGFNPTGYLVLEGAWRLDAFSAYPFRT